MLALHDLDSTRLDSMSAEAGKIAGLTLLFANGDTSRRRERERKRGEKEQGDQLISNHKRTNNAPKRQVLESPQVPSTKVHITVAFANVTQYPVPSITQYPVPSSVFVRQQRKKKPRLHVGETNTWERGGPAQRCVTGGGSWLW